MELINRLMSLVLVVVLCGSVLVSADDPEAWSKADIGNALSQFRDYDYHKDATSLRTVEEIVRYSQNQRELLPFVEAQMVKLLESEANDAAKRFICHQLWIIGTAKSVPALEEMLYDPNSVEMACYALRSNTSSEAGQALRTALDRFECADKIRVINILGSRRDELSVAKLIELIDCKNEKVGEAAVTALGKIGGTQASGALAKARLSASPKTRSVITEAYLQCAESLAQEGNRKEAVAIYDQLMSPSEPVLIRRSALLGAMHIGGPQALDRILSILQSDEPELKAAAISNSHLVKGKGVTNRLLAELEKLPPPEQALLIDALVLRQDAAVRPVITKMSNSPSPEVRIAVSAVLGTIGDASSVPVLARAVAENTCEDEKRTALTSLRRLKGEGVDEAILDAMAGLRPKARPAMIKVLSDRQITAAVALLLEEASSGNSDIRKAAFAALGRLADGGQLPQLVEQFVDGYDEVSRGEAERALITVAKKLANEAGRADAVLDALGKEKRTAVRCSLLRVLGGIANQKALQSLEATISTDSIEEADTAVRVLSSWPNTDALAVLHDVLKQPRSERHRVLAFRGYVQLIGLASTDSVKMYQDALGYATKADEIKLVLSGLGNHRSLKGLEIAVSYLENEKVTEEAALAAVKIAKKIRAPKHRDGVKTSMEKVLEVSKTEDTRKRAREVLSQVK